MNRVYYQQAGSDEWIELQYIENISTVETIGSLKFVQCVFPTEFVISWSGRTEFNHSVVQEEVYLKNNKPHGYYRQFEKLNKRRNLKVRK